MKRRHIRLVGDGGDGHTAKNRSSTHIPSYLPVASHRALTTHNVSHPLCSSSSSRDRFSPTQPPICHELEALWLPCQQLYILSPLLQLPPRWYIPLIAKPRTHKPCCVACQTSSTIAHSRSLSCDRRFRLFLSTTRCIPKVYQTHYREHPTYIHHPPCRALPLRPSPEADPFARCRVYSRQEAPFPLHGEVHLIRQEGEEQGREGQEGQGRPGGELDISSVAT